MSEIIGDYELENPLSNKNAGYSKWGFGEKDGKQYFIKEFLTPVCPEDNGNLSIRTLERKKKICNEFEKKETEMIKKINSASDGNVMRIHEFFRYGTKYYIATEKIDSVDLREVYSLPYEDKLRIIKVLSHSLMCLHVHGIIHGDIKMNNIVFTKSSSGKITAKIIDVDGCFSEDNVPEPDYLVVDPVYMAPETFNYIATESGKINYKIDVFAMGIIFYQILEGKMPFFDDSKYKYLYERALENGEFELNCGKLSEVITGMLLADPEKRLSMGIVFNELLAGDKKEEEGKKEIVKERHYYKNENKEENDKKVDAFFWTAGDL